MSIFIAVASIDPSRNELSQAFVRDTQDAADAMAAANTRPNLPWIVYELVECSRAEAPVARITRSRTVLPVVIAGDKNADPSQPPIVRSER